MQAPVQLLRKKLIEGFSAIGVLLDVSAEPIFMEDKDVTQLADEITA